jgi:hypothetical protein
MGNICQQRTFKPSADAPAQSGAGNKTSSKRDDDQQQDRKDRHSSDAGEVAQTVQPKFVGDRFRDLG